MKRIIVVLSLIVLSAPWAFAVDQPKVAIQTDSPKAALDDTITLTVSVSGGRPSAQPQIEGIEHFEILGTSTGEQVSIVNMTMTSSKTFSYTVRPKKAGGKVTLRAKVAIDGENRLSNAIEVETVQSLGGPRARRQAPPGFFNQPFFPPHMFGGGRKPQKGDFILNARISRTKVFAGQEVVYTLAFYRGAEIYSNINFQPPETKGFWTELPPEDQRYSSSSTKMSGRQYELTESRTMLYPLAEGTVTIQPGAVRFQPDPTEPPSVLRSNDLTLTVLPLPETGKPKDFSGLVGQFSLTASAPKQAVAGKPLTLSVAVTGYGNLHAIPRPQEPALEGFERYEPETKDNFIRSAKGSQGGRTFSFVLVPRNEGALTIGPFTLNAFNPLTGKYEALTTQPLTVDVAPTGSSPMTPSEKKTETPPAPGKEGTPFYRHPAFFAAAAVLIVGLMAGVVYLQRRNQIARDRQAPPGDRAKAVAEERLAKAKTAMEAGDAGAFHTEIEHAVRVYIGQKFNIPPSSVTPEELTQKLGPENAPRAGKAVAVLRKCIAARYAPAGTAGAPEELASLLAEAISAMEEMEK